MLTPKTINTLSAVSLGFLILALLILMVNGSLSVEWMLFAFVVFLGDVVLIYKNSRKVIK